MFGRLVVAGAQLGNFQLWPQGATEKNISSRRLENSHLGIILVSFADLIEASLPWEQTFLTRLSKSDMKVNSNLQRVHFKAAPHTGK